MTKENMKVRVYKQKLDSPDFIYIAFEIGEKIPSEKFGVYEKTLIGLATSLVKGFTRIGTDYTKLQLSFIPTGIQEIELSNVMTKVRAEIGLEDKEKEELLDHLLKITSKE